MKNSCLAVVVLGLMSCSTPTATVRCLGRAEVGTVSAQVPTEVRDGDSACVRLPAGLVGSTAAGYLRVSRSGVVTLPGVRPAHVGLPVVNLDKGVAIGTVADETGRIELFR